MIRRVEADETVVRLVGQDEARTRVELDVRRFSGRGGRYLNIVVCVKQVPDTTAKKELVGPDFLINRADLDAVINPFDEYAIEEGLRVKEAQGGEVTILTMGPESAEDSMRKALAMGADKGVLITDPALSGTDAWGTAHVLAGALRRLQFDLVITGMESTDARSGIVPGALAEELGLASLTYAAKLEINGGKACVNRQIPGGFQEVEAELPALVGVVKAINEPRYPSLKGIMASKRKEIQRFNLSDLDISTDTVGLSGSKTRVTGAASRAEKSAGEVIAPESPEEAARKIADFLVARKFL